MDTNVAGVMSMTRAFVPLLRKEPAVVAGQAEAGANVINISSLLGSVELTSGSFTCTSYRYRFNRRIFVPSRKPTRKFGKKFGMQGLTGFPRYLPVINKADN